MKRFYFILAVAFYCVCMSAQTPMLGEWVTVDDNTGEKISVVTIYQANNGKYYGKITQLLVGSGNEVCTACTGNDHNKPIVGLVIVRDMELNGNELRNGKVLDPENGKFYYAKIYLNDKGNLVLRGSLDKAGILGRSQTWLRK